MNYTPQKIIYSNDATIVFWHDGTKTIVKRAKGTKDDKYSAFCAALAKKVFRTNSNLKRIIKAAENTKRIMPEKKKSCFFNPDSLSPQLMWREWLYLQDTSRLNKKNQWPLK